MTWQKVFFNKLFKQGKNLVVLKRTPALHDLFLESASHGYNSYTLHVPDMNGVGFFAFDERYKTDHDFLEDDKIKSVFEINVSDDEYFYRSFDDMREIIFDEDTDNRFDVCSFYLKMIDLLFEKYNTKEIKPFLKNIFTDFTYIMFGQNFSDKYEYCKNAIFMEDPTEAPDILTFKRGLIKFINSSYLNPNNIDYMISEKMRFDEDVYERFVEKFWNEVYGEEDEEGWHFLPVSEFCESLEQYPSEIVMKSWSVATRTAGIVYNFHKDDRWNQSHGYQPRGQELLVVFLIINAKLINDKFVNSVSYIPEFEKEENLPKGLACVDNFTDLNEILGEELVESSAEALNNLGIRPKRGTDKLISAYISDKEIIGWIWVNKLVNTRIKGSLQRQAENTKKGIENISVELPAEYSFDVVVLPKYSGLGLGKKLICDAIMYIVNEALEDEKKGKKKGKLKINVINPYLIGYLRKLGFDLRIKDEKHYLIADLKNSEQIEKILSNCC